MIKGFVTAASILAMTGAAAAISGPAYGHGPEARYDRFMERFDGDGDGKITRQEVAAVSGQRFAQMDENGDGTIDGDEFMHHRQRGAEPQGRGMIEHMDGDGDGSVSMAEFVDAHREAAERRFRDLDGDGDGKLDGGEFATMHERRMRDVGRHMFERMDEDADGRVTLAEHAMIWTGWFDRLDRDGDGVVTVEEIRQGHGRMGRMHD